MRQDLTIMALSVREPWASQIRDGNKIEEYRTWSTQHRGDLLIVCSKLAEKGIKSKLLGKAIAIVNLTDCVERGPKDYVWQLTDIRSIDDPFPVQGRLGLFPVKMWIEDDLLEKTS